MNHRIKTIILKDNSEATRDRIEEAGITLCICTKFKCACWLDYHIGVTQEVHGVGYYGDDMGTSSQEEELARYVAEVKDPYYCKDVNEFIQKILETKKK